MSHQLAPFTQQLITSDEIRILAAKYCGDDFERQWAAFERGDELDVLYALVSEASHECDPVDGFTGAVPDSHTFSIDVRRIGPLYFVRVEEFDDVYFDSLDEALEWARDNYSSWIQAYEDDPTQE